MVSVGFNRFGFSREEETKEGGFGFSLVWFLGTKLLQANSKRGEEGRVESGEG
jgi:hypothetical protein